MAGTTRLSIKVVPGASRTCIAGWLGETLRIRVAVAAQRGKANAAVEALIAKTLSLPKGTARIVAGKTSPRKIVAIDGLSQAEMQQRFKQSTT